MRRVLVIATLLFACSGEEPKKAAPPATPPLDLLLKADPGEALSVLVAKEEGPGEEVVVVGRIKTIVKGFASFQLIDQALDYCGSGGDSMEDCPTPWDYCCIAGPVQNEHTLVVDADGEDGKVMKASGLAGLRLLDLVKVKGKLSRDEHDNVTLHATGWFLVERPNLREGLRWPE